MDLRSTLIESEQHKQKGGFRATALAVGLHGLLIGGVLLLSANASHKIDAEEKPIRAFVTTAAAPPPPPPPPPPPASSATVRATPHITPHIEPVKVPEFTQPRETPKETPQVEPVQSAATDLTPASTDDAPSAGGEVGGVSGGVVGGQVGGELGGTVGGEIGGVIGGQLGGTKDGQLGGTLGGQPDGSGESADAGPLRVGGDVKAPVATFRTEPTYSEAARKTRVNGVVIVEAIINKQGRVETVRVLKGLPMGLSESAENAVRQWRFRPGTLNGQPVDVVFNLTVNFTMG